MKAKCFPLPALLVSCALSAWALPSEPVFDPPAGVYPDAGESISVAIAAEDGCTIWYTTDGSRPVATNAAGEAVRSATARECTGAVALANGRETGENATSLIMSGEN